MPARKTVILLVASLLATSLACGCLEENDPEQPDLEISVLGAATMPAVWNSTGLVEPPQNHTFLLVELRLLNNGTVDIEGIAAVDVSLHSAGHLYTPNFLSGDITAFDPLSPSYAEAMCATSLPSLMDSLSPGGSTQALLLFSVPAELREGGTLTCSNDSALGKGRVASVTLEWSTVRAYDRAPPRLELRANDATYLNRTAPGGKVPMRYLVVDLNVTCRWSQPFVLVLLQMRLVDGDGMSHPIVLGAAWLDGPLADGPVLPGMPRTGSVAFELPPPMVPAHLVLDDAVPVVVEIDPTGIGYGK